jgi:hypothetical protein
MSDFARFDTVEQRFSTHHVKDVLVTVNLDTPHTRAAAEAELRARGASVFEHRSSFEIATDRSIVMSIGYVLGEEIKQ